MTALMDRPTQTPAPRPARRRPWLLVAAVLMALAAIALIYVPRPESGPAATVLPLPPLQGAQLACHGGTLNASGALVLDMVPGQPTLVVCVADRLDIPADRRQMLDQALAEAVPEFGNASNTISWGRFSAYVHPSGTAIRVEVTRY